MNEWMNSYIWFLVQHSSLEFIFLSWTSFGSWIRHKSSLYLLLLLIGRTICITRTTVSLSSKVPSSTASHFGVWSWSGWKPAEGLRMVCVCKDGERARKTYSKSQRGRQRAPLWGTNCMLNQAWPYSQRMLCAQFHLTSSRTVRAEEYIESSVSESVSTED